MISVLIEYLMNRATTSSCFPFISVGMLQRVHAAQPLPPVSGETWNGGRRKFFRVENAFPLFTLTLWVDPLWPTRGSDLEGWQIPGGSLQQFVHYVAVTISAKKDSPRSLSCQPEILSRMTNLYIFQSQRWPLPMIFLRVLETITTIHNHFPNHQ